MPPGPTRQLLRSEGPTARQLPCFPPRVARQRAPLPPPPAPDGLRSCQCHPRSARHRRTAPLPLLHMPPDRTSLPFFLHRPSSARHEKLPSPTSHFRSSFCSPPLQSSPNHPHLTPMTSHLLRLPECTSRCWVPPIHRRHHPFMVSTIFGYLPS
jgi:hypothetical protein